jgi:hypothetical protein
MHSESHERIISEHDLAEDGIGGPNIVRVEIYPPDDNYLLPLDQWVFRIDQNIRPDWAYDQCLEARARAELPAWLHDKVITDTRERVTHQVICLCQRGIIGWLSDNGHIHRMKDNARVHVCGQAHIQRRSGNATVGQVSDNGVVNTMEDDAKVERLLDTAQIMSMLDRSSVGIASGDSVIREMRQQTRAEQLYRRAIVHHMYEHAHIERMDDFSRVFCLADSAVVQRANANTIIDQVLDTAQVLEFSGSVVRFRNRFSCELYKPGALLVDETKSTPKVYVGTGKPQQITNKRVRTVTNIKKGTK